MKVLKITSQSQQLLVFNVCENTKWMHLSSVGIGLRIIYHLQVKHWNVCALQILLSKHPETMLFFFNVYSSIYVGFFLMYTLLLADL